MAEQTDLDPQLASMLDARPELREWRFDRLSPEEAREEFRAMCAWNREQGPPVAVADVSEARVLGGAGDLPARVYRPESAGPHPAVLWLHGGGWVLGDLDDYDGICRRLCRDADVVVVAPAYRLAPEHPFPAAVQDALGSARWVAAHVAELGGGGRWGIGGDSAGGNLAAVATHLLRDEGVRADAQLLAYPSVSMRGSFSSRAENASGCGIDLRSMGWMTRHYLGGGADPDDPRVSPLLSDSHAALPPAVVLTAGYDPLRDEGTAYACALEEAGVHVDLRHAPDLVHAFLDLCAVSDTAERATREGFGAFGRLLREV